MMKRQSLEWSRLITSHFLTAKKLFRGLDNFDFGRKIEHETNVRDVDRYKIHWL